MRLSPPKIAVRRPIDPHAEVGRELIDALFLFNKNVNQNSEIIFQQTKTMRYFE